MIGIEVFNQPTPKTTIKENSKFHDSTLLFFLGKGRPGGKVTDITNYAYGLPTAMCFYT